MCNESMMLILLLILLKFHFRFYPCIAGWTSILLVYETCARKRIQLLKSVYEEEFQRASDEDKTELL